MGPHSESNDELSLSCSIACSNILTMSSAGRRRNGDVGGAVASGWIRYSLRPWPTHLRSVPALPPFVGPGRLFVASVLNNRNPSQSRQGWWGLLTCSALGGSLNLQDLRELNEFHSVRVARMNVGVVGWNYFAVYLVLKRPLT